MVHKLGLSAIALISLGACSFHANMQAGSRTASQGESTETEARASDTHGGARGREATETSEEHLAAGDQPGSEQRAEAPAAGASQAAPATHDHDRGHGNDPDRVDEDNPGKSKSSDKAQAKAEKSKGDHDRGHGNDADGVDEDNPGKSKGKKGK